MEFYVLVLFILSLSQPAQSSTTTTPLPTPPLPPSPSPSAATGSTYSTKVPSNSVPAGTATSVPQGMKTGGPPGNSGSPVPDPDLPEWARCLSNAPIDSPADSSVPSLFKHWCSNYMTVIPCIKASLSTEAAHNPLDLFVKLHFDAETLVARSEKLCQSFQGVSDHLQCIRGLNGSLVAFCKRRFSLGLQYVYDVQVRHAFHNDVNVYKQIACQVTKDTTGCLGAAMASCEPEVREHVLAYYAVFTNDSCLANQTQPYTTPAPPPTQRPPSRDVVITCAQRVAQTLPTSGPPLLNNATQLEHLLHGLRENCRSFEARYNCYDQELGRITNPSFHDIWLSLTFDSKNAIKSQKEFCHAFEGGVVDSLTTDCYNRTHPSLRRCEDIYGHDVESIQRQWAHNRLDNVAVYQAACRSSLQRAFCLRDAFRACSQSLGEVMLDSELGTLPDICLTLLNEGKAGYGSSSSSPNSDNNDSSQSNYGEPFPGADATGYNHHPGTRNGQPPSRSPGDTGLSTGESKAEGQGQGAGGASGLLVRPCSTSLPLLLAAFAALSSRLL